MLSSRVPQNFEPNAWSRAVQAHEVAGRRTLDLSDSNPARVGLSNRWEAELIAAIGGPDVPPGAHSPRGESNTPRGKSSRRETDPDSPRGKSSGREPDPRRAIQAYYAGRGATVERESIVLTSSTSEGYAHLFRLLANPGETFLTPRPSYPLLEPLAALESVAIAHYRLAYEGAWRLDLDSLEAAIAPGVRAVVLVEPNNPTGSRLRAAEVEAVEGLCERNGLALVVDEVFGDFPWGNEAFPTLAGCARVPTFVLSGLSKVAGQPQLKLGWIVVSGPGPACGRALEGLEWIADLFLSVSAPALAVLPHVLAGSAAFQARVRQRVVTNLARLDQLAPRRAEVERLNAGGGWAGVLRMPGRRSGEEWAVALLEKHGVKVHPDYFYDFESGSHVVLSLIVEPRVFSEGLERLEALLAER